jgi:hypothetical protein
MVSERMRDEDKPLLRFPSLKPLCYYWLLIILFYILNIVCRIRNKSLWLGICTWITFLAGILFYVLLPVIPHIEMMYLTYQIIPSTVPLLVSVP